MTVAAEEVCVRRERLALPDGWLELMRWSERGPLLLLVHGLGDSGYAWEPLVERLRGAYQLVTVDLRGHGASAWRADGRYPIEAHVADLKLVLEQVAPGGCTLVGHSLGGQIALQVAHDDAQRVRRLVLVDSGPELKTEALAQAKERTREVQYFATRAQSELSLRFTYPLADQGTLARLGEREYIETPRGLCHRRDPAIAYTDWESEATQPGSGPRRLWRALAAMSCPTLVVRGMASAVFSEQVMQRMLAMLEDGSGVAIERAGHNVLLERPDQLARALVTFLQRSM